MSQYYEMMYILRPNLIEEEIRQNVEKYRQLLQENGADNVQVKLWGKRRLAYPIHKHQDGIYILMNYQGNGEQIAIIERDMRLSEYIIRYLTIKLKEAPPSIEDSTEDYGKVAYQAVDQQPSQPVVASEKTSDEQPSQPAPEGVTPVASEETSDEQPSQPAVASEETSDEQPSQPAPEGVTPVTSETSSDEVEETSEVEA